MLYDGCVLNQETFNQIKENSTKSNCTFFGIEVIISRHIPKNIIGFKKNGTIVAVFDLKSGKLTKVGE